MLTVLSYTQRIPCRPMQVPCLPLQSFSPYKPRLVDSVGHVLLLSEGNGRGVEGGETMVGLYCKREESIFNKNKNRKRGKERKENPLEYP